MHDQIEHEYNLHGELFRPRVKLQNTWIPIEFTHNISQRNSKCDHTFTLMVSFSPVGKLYCKLHFAQRKPLVKNGRTPIIHTVKTNLCFISFFYNSSVIVLQHTYLNIDSSDM